MFAKQCHVKGTNATGQPLTHMPTLRARRGSARFKRCICRSSSAETPGSSQKQGGVSRRGLLAGLTVGIPALTSCAPSLAEDSSIGLEGVAEAVRGRISEFTLPNGLHFIVLRRSIAPVVSCHIRANVGAFQEVDGSTGLAHLLEHMAFKGTPFIGTRDYTSEAPLLDACDEVFYELRDAMRARDASRVTTLSDRLQRLQARADELAVPNALPALLQQAGGVGLNAATSHDATVYYVSLPSNKLELWFALEAQRFQVPVWRSLYREKRVVMEERRLRVDNSPAGAFQEQFGLTAFANNYRRPVIGFMEDIEGLGRLEVAEFFQKYYTPRNLTISIVGDVDADVVQRYAERYWGGWNPSTTVDGTATTTVAAADAAAAALGALDARPAVVSGAFEKASRAGPLAMRLYYRESAASRDAVVYDALADVLAGGRTSRLRRRLVDTRIALAATAAESFPGQKYSNAMLLYGVPSAGRSAEDLAIDMKGVADTLADEGPTEAEVARVKRATAYQVMSALQSNSSMASMLCSYHVLQGSTARLFEDVAALNDLTSGRMRDVCQDLFQDSNSFVGLSPLLRA